MNLRNPFTLRVAERIDTETGFLRMFSSEVLSGIIEKSEKSELWNNVLFIRSSPGGGKTSLLYVFEPSVLNIVKTSNNNDLIKRLEHLGVLVGGKIQLLAAYILCSRSFETIEDLNVDPATKKRIFFSLLNSRIITSTLKAILSLKQKEFPNDLKYIQFDYIDNNNYFLGLKTPCNGEQLYNWANEIERNLYSIMDSLLPISDNSIMGHGEIFTFEIFNSENLHFNNQPCFANLLFMLDDAHRLTSGQRNFLIKDIVDKRNRNTIWIAERMEALSSLETIGAKEKRDYNVLNLEKYWTDHDSHFKKVLGNIANIRASMSSEEIDTFQSNIEDTIGVQYNSKLNESIDSSLQFFKQTSQASSKYSPWIDEIIREGEGLSLYEKAILYKQGEIVISRNKAKPQLSFDFFEEENFYSKIDGKTKNSAKLFISKERGIPFYYNFKDITDISSYNIEQFLSITSELFELMLSKKMKAKFGQSSSLSISAEEQHKILKKSSDWKMERTA